jgi:sodium-dependent dicarboxylate transporter 2/3/5
MLSNTKILANRVILLLCSLLGACVLIVPQTPALVAVLILSIALILWISETLPAAVVGLLIPFLASGSGLLSSAEAFGNFGSSIIILIICVMILTRVLVTSGLAERIALTLLASPLTGTTLRSLCTGILIACWLTAWWISNTAACALFVPIVLGLLTKLDPMLKAHHYASRVRYRLLLTCAFVPSLGGMVTPVGSLPNLVSMTALSQHGVSLSFLDWMGYSLPASVIFIVALILIFEFRYPIPNISLKDLKQEMIKERLALPPLSAEQRGAAASFLFTITLWILPTIASRFGENGIAASLATLSVHSAAIIGVGLLFSLASMQCQSSSTHWKSASQFDWGIVLLFGGGLCLGEVVTTAKLPEIAFSYLGFSSNHTSDVLSPAIALASIPLTIILSEICSNTVAAAVLVPAILGIAPGNVILPVIIALAAGFGFMMPISTPPNALVYSTGKLPLRQMILTGLLLDILGVIFLFGYYWILQSL